MIINCLACTKPFDSVPRGGKRPVCCSSKCKAVRQVMLHQAWCKGPTGLKYRAECRRERNWKRNIA